MNLLFQLITACHLFQHLFTLRLRKSTSTSSSLSFLSSRSSHSTSLLLGICTLGALVAYILEIRPLQGDVHLLTLISRTPHPRAQPLSITEDYYNLHQRLYDLALVCIYASAVIQLSTGRNVITKMDRDNIDTGRNHRHQERYTKAPEWAVVLISLAGAVALAAMSSPLLEAFLGGDFDKERRLSGASTVTAFLLVLWRFVTFLDIFSTTYSLRNQEHKDAAVLALWQRASLPMAAELSFDLISILFYERATLRPFTRDDDGTMGSSAAIHIFDSPLAIAFTALTLALAKVLVERNNAQSTSTSHSNSNLEHDRDAHNGMPLTPISSR